MLPTARGNGTDGRVPLSELAPWRFARGHRPAPLLRTLGAARDVAGF